MQTITATPDTTAENLRADMLATLRDVAADASVSLEDAALLSVSLASAYLDLCRLLGIAPPQPVEEALDW